MFKGGKRNFVEFSFNKKSIWGGGDKDEKDGFKLFMELLRDFLCCFVGTCSRLK